MSDIEIRIAIAEACGWLVTQADFKSYSLRSPEGKEWHSFDYPEIAWTANVIPNYPNDLNAMHEAIRSLDRFQQRDLVACLRSKLMTEKGDDVDDALALLLATPAQLSEQFVRTIGKWNEPKATQ